MNLALTFFDITNLSGGGGAERFFYDFFVDYNHQSFPKHKLVMITDGTDNIEKSGRKIVKENIIKILNYRYYNFRIFNFLNKRNSFLLGNLINALKVSRIVRQQKINKLVVPFYHPREFYFYKFLNILGVPVDYFIVDCRIPDNYISNTAPYHFRNCYERFFQNIRFNNIHTWYQSVENFIREQRIIKHYNKIHSYRSRYSKIKIAYDPSLKKNILVYAARMDQQKDPMFFLSALKLIKQREQFNDWKVLMFGEGPLLGEVTQFITENNLNMVNLGVSGNLENVFSESRIFVSTQKYENFPSLAVSEAMSKGNIIVAKNVGQTYLLVKKEENGFLCEEGNIESLASCLAKAFSLTAQEVDKMARKSIDLMSHEHTLAKFVSQFDEFVLP